MNLQTTLLSNDVLGWTAALLTLLTFVCRDMRRLRLLALAANAAFIAYGALAQLLPVLALHLALVPVNLWRLNQTLRPASRRDDAASAVTQAEASGPRVPRPRSGWTPARRRRIGSSRTAAKSSIGAADHEPRRPSLRLSQGPATGQCARADDQAVAVVVAPLRAVA